VSRLLSLVMWVLFVAGLIGCLGGSHIVHKAKYQHLVLFGGLALSLVGGSYVTRKEPLKSLLKTRGAMWFLFLFNLGAAGAALLLLHGSTRFEAGAGLGIVSLGAGLGLLKSIKAAPAEAGQAPPQQDLFLYPDQGQQYPFRDQDQRYSFRDQGQQYPFRDQGERYPFRDQGRQYPPRDPCWQYPPRDQGEQYPPDGVALSVPGASLVL
jgi:hypothetical protein